MATDSPLAHPSDSRSANPPKGLRVEWPHVVLSVLGLAASAWAVHVHLLIKAGAETGCGISETISCDQVIGSDYGQFLGIPLGVFGALFWALVLVTAVSNRTSSARIAAWQRLVLGTIGLGTSLVLAWISLGVLRHFCPVCATTHVLSGINFLVALAGVWKLRKKSPVPQVATYKNQR